MAKAHPDRTVVTPEFRLAFPHLFEKSAIPGTNSEPKYSAVLLFDADADLSALKNALQLAAIDKWGNNIPQGLKNPIRSGDEQNAKRAAQGKEPLQGYEGKLFINVSSTDQPGVVDETVQPILDPSVIYAGCYGRAQLYAHPYATGDNIGVTFFLNHIQKTRDGEKFSGRSSPQDVFSQIQKPAAEANAAAGGGIFD